MSGGYQRNVKILVTPDLRAERIEFVRLNPEYFMDLSDRMITRLREQVTRLHKRIAAYKSIMEKDK